MRPNLLTAAFRYLDAGHAVIPIWPDDRKNPHLTSYARYTKYLPTKGDWVRWAYRWPAANIGLITGYWGLVGLDFDDAASYAAWVDGPGLAGQTWTVRTRRGYHVWFRVTDDPGKSRMYTQEGREVLLRAKGGYCIVPPSIHHTGARYSTVHKVPPLEIDSIEPYLSGWEIKQAAPKPRVGIKTPVLSENLRMEQIIPPHGKPNSRGAAQAFCPFHDDHRPSAWVNVEEQRFGCNACWPGQWWDVVNVYAMLNGLDNGDAWGHLAGNGRHRASPQKGQ